jgi:hypothetical protein
MRRNDAEDVCEAAYGTQHLEMVVLRAGSVVSVAQLPVVLAETVRDFLCQRMLDGACHSEPGVRVFVRVERVPNLNVVTRAVDPSCMGADLVSVRVVAPRASRSLAAGARQSFLRVGTRLAATSRSVKTSPRDGSANGPSRELSR